MKENEYSRSPDEFVILICFVERRPFIYPFVEQFPSLKAIVYHGDNGIGNEGLMQEVRPPPGPEAPNIFGPPCTIPTECLKNHTPSEVPLDEVGKPISKGLIDLMTIPPTINSNLNHSP